MTSRPPDWERRLRELERRTDNRGTDIVRLWQGLPQAPELPGYAMPVIIPDATTPAPTTTTTTTSTSSTTTSSTTTSSTTTTSPPLSCYSKWPSSITLSMGSFTPQDGYIQDLDGTFICTPFSCSPGATYRTLQYQSPVITTAFGSWGRWMIVATLTTSDLYPGTGSDFWWGVSPTSWDQLSLQVRIGLLAGSVIFNDSDLASYTPAADGSGLCGDIYSVPLQSFGTNYETAPASCTLQFSGTYNP